MPNTITAYSTPDYDDWGFDSYWDCGDWVTWHKEMVKVFGKTDADYRFAQAWQNRSIFGHELTCSLGDSSFISYFKSQGFEWDPISGLIANIGQIVNNVGNAAANTTKLLSFLIPVIVLIAAVALVIWANKKYKIA